MMASVFIAGATGYMGSRLVGQLVDHGHQVKALSRRPVDLPCEVVHGDALDAARMPSTSWDAPRLFTWSAHRTRRRGRKSSFAQWTSPR